MLLEAPNPKDPQDAQVASMMINQPKEFAAQAQEWAIQYAGAPRAELDLSKYGTKTADKDDINKYVFSRKRKFEGHHP